MRGKYRPHHILQVVLLFIALAGFSASNSKANENSKYLDAVREFADNVLKYGRDTYGPKHTPLFVDGLNIHTHEPVKWISPEGERWILSNLASQQNLFRTLDGLTKITGDPKYRQAAVEAIKYAFANLQSPNGLLYWGNSTAYDAQGDEIFGWRIRKRYVHVLKSNLPYYELMWKVNPEATKTFIEAFWSAHIIDWSNLDMDRIGYLGERLEEPWNHEYKVGPTFFKSKRVNAGAIVLTGSSLVHAGSTLYKLTGQEQSLVWSKRLAKRYVDTRHPKTGISAFLYNGPWLQLGDDLKEHFLDPHTTVFPFNPFEFRYLQYPQDTGAILDAFPWMSICLVGRMLAEEGKEFTRWALEELTAWGKAAYRKRDNSFVPMLTDGSSLEGYVWKKGLGCSSGVNVAKPYPADSSFFWAYSVVYCTTGDEYIWEMVRDIALGNSFGDIGETPAHTPELQTNTTCSNVYCLFGFLELYEKTKKRAYLKIARRIGDNILSSQFHKGFFIPSKKYIYTRFGSFEPLALLHLDVAMKSKIGSVPRVWPSAPLFVAPYRYKEEGVDLRVIYAMTESPEPPVSLQEAAAIGDANLVRILIENGTNVESLDDSFLKTALHRAARSGHKDVVELLLAKGADVDARASASVTPLHYAAERGRKEIAELLIAKGADVNATDSRGDTPLHRAARAGHRNTVELLINKGANVNAKNSAGDMPLHYATRTKDAGKSVIELLISKGANLNARNKAGQTPLDIAQGENRREIVELLRKHGAKEVKSPQTASKQ